MSTLLRLALAAALSFVAAGCVPELCAEVEALPGGPDDPAGAAPQVLAIGDSIFAVNAAKCQAVPCHAALGIGAYVDSRAVSGQPLTDETGAGQDITSQLEPGAWSWVILDGGANDLAKECACGNAAHVPAGCEALLDDLADPVTGEGEMRDLLDAVATAAPDAEVALVGYYDILLQGSVGWAGCWPYVTELTARYEELAADDDRVHFVDASTVMDPDAFPDGYAWDKVHPSPAGSEAIGGLVAATIGTL